MIANIRFQNFRGFEDFTITIKEFNVLTGPNNNGKSTLIDGLRALQAAHRYASHYLPKFIDLPFGLNDAYGYEIPEKSIPLILENVQRDFNLEQPSLIKYKFVNGNSLTLLFHPDYPIYFFIDCERGIRNKKDFQREFAINISIVPTLGPFEVDEDLLDKEYVNRWYGSRRSPRMFRSFWYYNPENFQEMQRLLEETWPNTTISLPEKKGTFGKELIMFCGENRMPREVCWAGFGFQIWLQLLTHVVNSKDADIIVVDEPEVYLHPDLQHKILKLLRLLNTNVLIATHSVEIINSVEPSDVVLIDKKNKRAKRISDLNGLQAVSDLLGSGQNIQLTRLARGKRILFVEGKDLTLLNRLAKVAQFDSLLDDGYFTVIPFDGFSQHERVIQTDWGFKKILGEEIKISILLDRDFRSKEEIDSVVDKLKAHVDTVHVHKKKEIENYFIVPNAIFRAIKQRLNERKSDVSFELDEALAIIEKVCQELKASTLPQLIAHKVKIEQKRGTDVAPIVMDVTIDFESKWTSSDFRYSIVCGKDFVSLLNAELQKTYKVSISYALIAGFIKRDDLGADLLKLFERLNEIKQA